MGEAFGYESIVGAWRARGIGTAAARLDGWVSEMPGDAQHDERPRRATGARSRRTLHAETLGLGAQLSAALDGVSQPLIVIDRAGSVVLLNRAFEAWIGLDAQRVLQAPVQALLHAASEPNWYLANAHSPQPFTTLVQAAKATAPVQLELRPLLDDAGTLTHFCAVVTQGTQELGQLTRLGQPATLATMGRLAAELAHDINNQLAVVLNYSFVLRRSLEPALAEHMDELQGAAWRAASVARKLLGLGRRPLSQPTPLNLGDTLREMEPLLTHVLQGVALEVQVEPHLPTVVLLPSQAEQLLMGLCLELRELVGPGGQARLSLERVELVPGTLAPEGLAPGRYLVLTATGSATERAHDDELAIGGAPPRQDDAGPVTLQRLAKQARGHLSVASTETSHALRVLLPVREF